MVTAERNRSIDILKGMLIFMVVLGHALLGSLDESPLRYLIYSFHMPAFFFVSGFLLNLEGLRQASFTGIFKKYWRRMLRPWCIAWVVYTLYAVHSDMTLLAWIHNLYSPYYHLWFVPSLFLCVIICMLFVKRLKDNVMAEVALVCLGLFLCLGHYSSLGTDATVSCGNLAYLLAGVVSQRLANNVLALGGGGQ